jgi:hypothetical protein
MSTPLATEDFPKPKWYFNIGFVIVMMFFVTGPFGLPLVWKNPHFSRRVKGALTLVMIVYTIWMIDLARRVFRMITEGLIPPL